MIFVDSTFLIGLVNKKDQWHKDSKRLAPMVKKSERWISNIVMIETLNGLSKLLDGKQVEIVYNSLNNDYNFYMVDKNIQDKAIQLCKKYNNNVGYADTTHMVIMEELGINEIVSFDTHFDNKEGIIRIK
ncbi:MAG: PIN domain-containing protein [Methanobrevibacter sp.]|nr:PIN domain-containing protein [Candidatus Methanoflexus mossambicus]